MTALFTATSAVCLTGLIVVDTATYWSHFGQAVIVVLIQLGGLGIMTLAVAITAAVEPSTSWCPERAASRSPTSFGPTLRLLALVT